MGSVKLLKMQHHKELKRGSGSGGAPGSSPAPAGRAQHQQVGGGGPTRTVSGCRVPGALFYTQVLVVFVQVWELPALGMGAVRGWRAGSQPQLSPVSPLKCPFGPHSVPVPSPAVPRG